MYKDLFGSHTNQTIYTSIKPNLRLQDVRVAAIQIDKLFLYGQKMIDQNMIDVTTIEAHKKNLDYQYLIQRSATSLVLITLLLVVLAAPTGIALSSDPITNEALNGHLHKFAGHGLIVIAVSQVIVLFLGRKFHITKPSA